jgi:ATP-binding cassette subfamily B protein
VVFAAFGPAVLVIRAFQRRLAGAYGTVRKEVGAMLAAVSESVVGAAIIRAYGVSGRTAIRLDAAIDGHRRAQQRALRTSVLGFSTGELAAGLALSSVVVVGISLGVLDVAPDVSDPGTDGVDLPAGPLDVRFAGVSFAYSADGPTVLHDIEVEISAKTRVAVVGETGGGKTTFAKLLTRLMDPTDGTVLLSGVPLPRVRFGSLRARVVMVPQDGFLFDTTVAENVRFGRPALTDPELAAAVRELGLSDWVEGLPQGLVTQVGERGEALSVGERQLVALARAYVADPDLLVLDEATSAVDPATEVRLQRTLDAVTRGRTTVTIAHRLSTAQAADEVIVVDKGRIVQRGSHEELVADPSSVYGRLYASWLEQTR